MSTPEPTVIKVEPGKSFTFMTVKITFTKKGKLQVNGLPARKRIVFTGRSGGGCASHQHCLCIVVEPGVVHAFSGTTYGPSMINDEAIIDRYDNPS